MRKVLVVDDDSAILEVLEMRLTAMGFDVTATGDPQEAQRHVDGGRFDLALVDLRMEPMDVIRLMESLHDRQPRLTVVTAEYRTGALSGVIGVIGPTRMPYDKVIAIVRHTSLLVSDLLD